MSKKVKPISRFAWALPLALSPLQLALAQALCPAPQQPWACERQGEGEQARWACEGRWQTPEEVRAERPDPETSPTELRADSITSADGNIYQLNGDVELKRSVQRLNAPGIEINRSAQTAKTTGVTRMETQQLLVFATGVETDMASDTSTLTEVRYALKDGRGNGTARKAIQQGDLSRLTGVSFTSCPGDVPAWQVRANEIELDHEKGIGHAKNFSVMVGRFPVFYLPAASFPLTDERKSGLLAPTISVRNKDGLDLLVPYYFNLAPNYDATVSTRILQKRGVMLGGEFRYLGEQSSGTFNGTFLPGDRLRDLAGSDNRYSANINYANQFSTVWRFGTSLNHFSDDFYFEDLGDSLTTSATSIVGSDLGFYGRSTNDYFGLWNAGIMTDRFELIDPSNPDSVDPYRRAPRLFFNSENFNGGLSYGLKSELVNFRRDEGIEGTRFDVQPFVRYEWRTPSAYLRPEVSFRHTRYDLDGQNDQLTRSLPIAAVDMGLFFDRPQALFFPDLRQTLEPRLYYLRAPFREQSLFPNFDTTELDFSFPQLFRTNRFSGADRQADANQLAAAVTTRWIDDVAGVEKLRLSLGQIRYFDDSQVSLLGGRPLTSSAGVWVAEAQAQIGQRWRVAFANQYDPEISRTRLSALRIQRTIGDQGLVNLGYRYRAGRLEQTDISGLAPINERWSLIGRWNYSLPEKRTLEGLAGFEYRSCCWRLRILGRHHLRAGTLEGRNSIFFELELNGLGVLGRKTDRLLDNAIVGFADLYPESNKY